ncbi:GTP pyrophosphokinase [Aureibacillus halotolerans]|uniref:GTP diphosphokinase n=1 Tax=Aureibacillus halotolerans TaxID=1508390 RepID=A0A4R6U8S2_9BACI|nr:GTP pyrophosphokinase family protein [Aureibacillus halotolerans]TDQ42142.1 putative GTP pyrophosphokinase [Aureibacillus halotolerans]
MENWEAFLAPYEQAIEELKVKLKGMRKLFEVDRQHSPIEFVTGRVKPIPSILDKARRKNVPFHQIGEGIQDIAGLRMMCQFVDDITSVVELLRERNDFDIVEERDYIANKKESGYRSYHLVLRYPVQTVEGEKKLLVEIQIRTLAMNFWATVEHSLNYKYKGQLPSGIEMRIQRAAEAAFRLDEEMSKIRGEIQEAHQVFLRKLEKNNPSTDKSR